MLVQFSKMHGLGNDFLVVDAVTQQVFFNKAQIIKLSHRHTGIGFDQMLLVEAPYDPDIDFYYRIFNADGSEVEQCGNGARCLGRFVRLKGLTNKSQVKVATKNSVLEIQLEKDNQVTVDMGAPVFEPQEIPFIANKTEQTYVLRAEEQTFLCGALSMGNPHCVLLVDDIKKANVREIGRLLTKHERFPQGVNVGFLQIMSRTKAKLRVYERGVGETQACGTGACAAAVWAIREGLMDEQVEIELPGGKLIITWREGETVSMKGPAEHVFDGVFMV